ncbi:hypothetical protein [uncultured Aquabacterium sp.]|uniref:hypothetical protein n=1 Tax=uncultured Aquabacterium sp. TaxID=158753 RepID=UPI0025D6990E|nr:hypothetical protein [uncultured Aquabacterium sp.]
MNHYNNTTTLRAPERDMSALIPRKNPRMGQQLKLNGIARVEHTCADWLAGIEPHLKAWLQAECIEVDTFTMEQFKAHAVASELPMPPHQNGWGALTRRMASRHVIEWTGEHVTSQAPDAHGRPTKLWRYVPGVQ